MTGSATARARTTFSAADLATRTMQRRAVEAVIWGIPAVNFDLMYQSHVRELKGAVNQIAYWSRMPTWKNQTLTPNPDTIYLMPFFSTKDVGPLVIEIPPADEGSITGTIMDCWQAALEDVGPAGLDKGQGGKYLITPPGFADTVPAGYFHLPSNTNQGYALLRSILKSHSESDIAKAVAYGKRIKLYPLSQAANPPQTVFVDAVDVVFDAVIPYDVRFFESLDRMVQAEALAGARPRDDRSVEIGRHRAGQAVQPRPKGRRDSHGRRPGGARLVRRTLRGRLRALRQWLALVSPGGQDAARGGGGRLHEDGLPTRRTAAVPPTTTPSAASGTWARDSSICS